MATTRVESAITASPFAARVVGDGQMYRCRLTDLQFTHCAMQAMSILRLADVDVMPKSRHYRCYAGAADYRAAEIALRCFAPLGALSHHTFERRFAVDLCVHADVR